MRVECRAGCRQLTSSGPRRAISMRKQLAGVLEGLELQRIAGRVIQEEGRLLAYLAPEADPWLNDEALPGPGEPSAQFMPALPRQHDTEVRDRHLMTVHGVRGLDVGPTRSVQ